jgi:quinol monooxygenase YgiN
MRNASAAAKTWSNSPMVLGDLAQIAEIKMLSPWISPEALASLDQGFVVAIMLEAKTGHAEALAEILRVLTPPTMAEPGVKLFLPYRSPTNPSLFFIFELYVNEAAWGAHEATEHFKIAIKGLLPIVTRRERIPFVPFLAV